MHTIKIRKVTAEDISRLQQISRQTFYETFSSSNKEEDMLSYLSRQFSGAQLLTELNDNNSTFYFALQGDQITGYLKLNSGAAQTELQEEHGVEIERIYVLKTFQRRQIGQMLLDKAIQYARKKNAVYIWLGVWENNTQAIRFYNKNGFVEFDRHLFLLGEDRQTDIMMKLVLSQK